MGGAGPGGGCPDPQPVPRGARRPPVGVGAPRRPRRLRGGSAVVGPNPGPAAERQGTGSELHGGGVEALV